MRTDKDRTQLSPPAEVRAGQKLKESTINRLIAIAGAQQIHMNRLPFKGVAGGHFNFEVERVSGTSVTVRAGAWIRNAAGNEYVIAMGIDGPSTSIDLKDVLTITGFSAAGTTYWVILTLTDATSPISDPLNPDTLTASKTTTAPGSLNDDDFNVRYIAKVVTGSGSTISTVQNLRFFEDFFLQPDGVSLEYNSTTKKLQQYGWNNPTRDTLSTLDLIEFWNQSDGTQHYTDSAGIADFLVGAGQTWGDGNAPWEDVDVFDHGDLAGLDDDDHYGPNYPYFILGDKNAAGKAAQYARNTEGANDNFLGRSLFLQTDLHVEGTTDITNGNPATGSGQFLGGVSIAKKLIIGSATAASGDNTGALQISGGFSAQEKSTLSDELELTNTDIEVHIAVAATSTGIDVFGSIYEASIVSNTYNAAGRFSDGTREVEIADGTMAINATGGINTSDAFYHGLNQGLSRASNVNLVDDDGLAIPVIIGGGLILPR